MRIPALVKIIVWRCPCDKPLSEPMMIILPTHICVTRPPWVKYGKSQCIRNVNDFKFCFTVYWTPLLLNSCLKYTEIVSAWLIYIYDVKYNQCHKYPCELKFHMRHIIYVVNMQPCVVELGNCSSEDGLSCELATCHYMNGGLLANQHTWLFVSACVC